MRRHLLPILILLSFASPSWAWGLFGMAGAAPAASSCSDTLADNNTASVRGDAGAWGKNASSDDWVAGDFTAGSSYTLCRVDVNMSRTANPASPDWNITACIYTDNGSFNPTTEVSCSTNTHAESTLSVSTTYTYMSFTGLSAAITSGTVYHIVLKGSGVDGTNYPYIGLSSTNGAGHYAKSDGDGTGAWATLKTDRYIMFRTYK